MLVEDTSPKAALYEGFALVGKALGNPARIELLNLLAQGERGAGELAAAAGLRLSNTSAQLSMLAAAGLVTARRSGTPVFYRLPRPPGGGAGARAALRPPRVLPARQPAGDGPGRTRQAGRLRPPAAGPRGRPGLAGRHRGTGAGHAGGARPADA